MRKRYAILLHARLRRCARTTKSTKPSSSARSGCISPSAKTSKQRRSSSTCTGTPCSTDCGRSAKFARCKLDDPHDQLTLRMAMAIDALTTKTATSKRDVLRLAKERDVRFVRLAFADVLGVSKNVSIPVSELDAALDGKMTFDGGSIDGFVRGEELDMILRPDPATFALYPWSRRSARRACFATSRCPTVRRSKAARERRSSVPREAAARCFQALPPDRSRILSVRSARNRVRLDAHLRRRLVFRLLCERSRRGCAQRDRFSAAIDGRRGSERASRARAGPARNRFPPHRRTGGGGRAAHAANDCQACRRGLRTGGDVHAQTARRPRRQRSARELPSRRTDRKNTCTPSAVCWSTRPR